MSRDKIEWGIKQPNEWAMMCEGCGETFYTSRMKQKYHSRECQQRAEHERLKEREEQNELRRLSRLGRNPSNLFMFEFDISLEDDPYSRIDQLGIDDGTDEILHLLRRQIVGAHRLDHEESASCFDMPVRVAVLRVEAYIAGKQSKKKAELTKHPGKVWRKRS